MSDLDDQLRARLRRAAEQAGADAQPAPAAAAVQAGLASGSSTKLWTILAIVGVAGGGVLGATVLGRDDPPPTITYDTPDSIVTFSCPDDEQVGTLPPGGRVVVVGRDEAATWLAIRSPEDPDARLWIENTAINVAGVDDLPVVGCDEDAPTTSAGTAPTQTTPPATAPDSTPTTAPTTAPSPTTSPGTNTTVTVPPTTAPPQSTVPATIPPPTAPPDVTPPVVGQPAATFAAAEELVCVPNQTGYADRAVITVTITDNIAVTSAQGVYDGTQGGASLPGSFTLTKGAGNTWTGTFGPFASVPPGYWETIQIQVRAFDAAGNMGLSQTVGVDVLTSGNCPT